MPHPITDTGMPHPITGTGPAALVGSGPAAQQDDKGVLRMPTAREAMTGGAECARTTDILVEAARKMRELDVGAISGARPNN